MKVVGKIICILVIGLGVAFGYICFEAHQFLQTKPNAKGQPVYFDLLPGQNVFQVAQNLAKANIITNAKYFTYLARFNKLDHKLKAGRFALNTGWLPNQVLDTLVFGHPVLYRVTVPEGLPVWQVGHLLAEKGFLEFEQFMAVVRDPIFLRNFGIPFDLAEGFLMPDTYLLKRKDQEESLEEVSEKKESATNDSSKLETKELADQTKEAPAQPNEVVAKKSKDQAKEDLEAAKKEAKDALQPAKAKKFSIKDYLAAKSADYRQAWRVCARLVDNFWQKADTLWPNRKRPTASQLKEWVILASIVEKETAVGSERARVAGVYKNRLERKMLLQADPTIIYGLGPNFQGKLLYRHLDDVKNIYNTYQHPGLPPTPICSFGIGALKAAIYPETHNFLYFVAKGGNGEHTFSKNLTDHNLAVEQYRKWTRTHKQ